MNLQNGRNIKMEDKTKIASKNIFHLKSRAAAFRKCSFCNTSGRDAWSVPVGQMNLQKYGDAMPSFRKKMNGSAITKRASKIYFTSESFRVNANRFFVFRIFFVGIL